MNFSVRSSRVTGPNTRTDRLALVVESRTAALRSKTISEPSGRRTPLAVTNHHGACRPSPFLTRPRVAHL